MSTQKIAFDHIHIISADPHTAAQWYVDILGGVIENSYELRGAPQIAVAFDESYLLIRGQRPGEGPSAKPNLQDFADYASHDQWGTDHFGFRISGDFDTYCEALRAKGAKYLVEPHDFLPGSRIAYLAAPDGVTVELVQAKG
jgi:catechol 2,3-dioxygenase-like lactoylglutathione lyase family enzyme